MTNSEIAAGYIQSHCPHIGSYCGDLAPYAFIADVAKEMAASPLTDLFPERSKEHVAYALDVVARHGFLEPPAAVASVYLATRMEFYFRLLSGLFRGNGTWINQTTDRPRVIQLLGKDGLQGKRVNKVAVTYRLMKLNKSHRAAQAFEALDSAIYRPGSLPLAGGRCPIENIGDRIAYLRNASGHGEWGDISADAIFYGLVTAIVFYNQ